LLRSESPNLRFIIENADSTLGGLAHAFTETEMRALPFSRSWREGGTF
jgi:hypothetical protein